MRGAGARRGLFRAVWLALVALGGCKVSIPDDGPFSCSVDQDCGGGAYRCSRSVCCLPSEELCDGKDNDCDGDVDELDAQVCYAGPDGTLEVGRCRAGTSACVDGAWASCAGQVLPGTEQCNQQDDDCDGRADEDFDFTSDGENCGVCGRRCGAAQACVASNCSSTVELRCDDGVDDDSDGKKDCADPDCETKSCGTGCTCSALAKTETTCGDGTDNDGDGPTDCADSDCSGLACGAGCTCRGTTKAESNCRDALDNDGDNFFDCLDSDCAAQACRPSPYTYVCSPDGGSACTCNGSPAFPPSPELRCNDGLDENCSGQTDCLDPSCANRTCAADGGVLPDGGTSCICRSLTKVEANCGDLDDNDGDGKVDCADFVDCPLGAWCRFLQGPNLREGTCRSDTTCRQ